MMWYLLLEGIQIWLVSMIWWFSQTKTTDHCWECEKNKYVLLTGLMGIMAIGILDTLSHLELIPIKIESEIHLLEQLGWGLLIYLIIRVECRYFWTESKFNSLKQIQVGFDQAISLIPSPLVISSQKNGKILYANELFSQVFKINKDLSKEAIGNFYHHIIQPNFLNRDGPIPNYEVTIGEGYSSICLISNRNFISWRGEPAILEIFHDITSIKQDQQKLVDLEKAVNETEAQLMFETLHDPLTGLANQTLLMDRLAIGWQRAKRVKKNLTVFCIDIDRFTFLNNSLGQPQSDRLLIQVANLLQNSIGKQDILARIGADEFAILVEDHNLDQILLKVKNINQNLSSVFNIGGHLVNITVSIGIANLGDHYTWPGDLLRDSKIAMTRAKKQGYGGYQIFSSEMHQKGIYQLKLESDLRNAIAKEEFILHYQPILMLKTNKIKGFEALIRWKHPMKGWISPNDFIPIAEDTGLIIPIGQWVIKEVCRQIKIWEGEWLANNPDSSFPITVNINVSGKQLIQPNFISQIDEILNESQVKGKYLKLEITETVVIEKSDQINELLTQLKLRQIKCSIDDFGIGYSSLERLADLAIDTVKIDRSFLNRTTYDAENWKIIGAMIDLSHSLKMDVTVEGIETIEQLEMLKQLSCENGQGYYFSKPVDKDTAKKMIG